MKRFKFITPAIAAAVLALPVVAQNPAPTLEEQQRQQLRNQRQQLQREALQQSQPAQNELAPVENQPGVDREQWTTSPPEHSQQDPSRPAQESDGLPAPTQSEPRQDQDARTPQDTLRNSEIQQQKAYASGEVSSRGHLPYLGRINKASELMGFDVKGTHGEEVGEVSDFVMDLNSGRVVLAVLEVGGILGIGADEVAVPITELSPDMGLTSSDNGARSLRIIHSKLESAPKLDTSRLSEQSVAQVLQAYNGQQKPQASGHEYAATQKSDAGADDRQDSTDIERPGESDRVLVRGEDDSTTQARTTGAQYHLASNLIGMEVQGSSGEKIGKIHEIGVDMANGRITTMIVSSGGFLGIGDRLSAVPPGAFRWDEGSKVLRLNATREQLQAAPNFSRGEWPKEDNTYVGQSYRAFNVDPYFHYDDGRESHGNGGQAAVAQPQVSDQNQIGAEADNTRVNVRDRQEGAVTPLDQGNNQADLNTTAQIRRALMDDENLSFNARNVKIITEGGKVTLRGPVDSEEEKAAVQRIAEQLQDAARIDNQLEVRNQR